ncbi:VOC family protein [Chitinophaga tropicalis]|uniref:Glyoxalase n=1 Tax=Chitinophaga tropicalis TaxID=2683588 RepID=A0A7K1UE11_9BACT|nr:glyoxalase [Chitinophaga tropicalis]MVT12621.1 glyoxalase [Chitinophaga tropicalis]
MRIKRIELLTNDIIQTKLFYTRTLQFSIQYETNNSISFKTGASILTFRQDNSILSPVYHFAFNIPHNQLEEAIIWMTGKAELLSVTSESKTADFSHWNANAVYFSDNSGNILELIARHDLDNGSDTPFSSDSIQCISEIGIAVDNVPLFMDCAIKDHGLNIFSKQQPQEKFAALGDDNGLLIIAETDRNWFPTSVPARKFPTGIVLGNGNNEEDIQLAIHL